MCFQFMDLSSPYFWSLDKTFRRVLLFTVFEWPVLTCPAGLHINGEAVHVQLRDWQGAVTNFLVAIGF